MSREPTASKLEASVVAGGRLVLREELATLWILGQADSIERGEMLWRASSTFGEGQ